MSLIKKHFQLKEYNTFHVSAFADAYAEFSNLEQLREILTYAKENTLPFLVIGAGANILFTSDFKGLVIRPISKEVIFDGNTIVADAGVLWDDLVSLSVDRGLGGLENLSAIPGTVGASPVQNIGAYGSEAADSIKWVEYFDVRDMQSHRLSGGQCGFGYRNSVFKRDLRGFAVILKVAFSLTPENNSYNYKLGYKDLSVKMGSMEPSVSFIRKCIMEIRSEKLPDPNVTGNAGSFFRNPEISPEKYCILREKFPDIRGFALSDGRFKLYAGWMIEKAGWKGKSIGRCAVHDRQALVLINNGEATGNEVLALSSSIRKDVYNLFEIDLQPEVIIL